MLWPALQNPDQFVRTLCLLGYPPTSLLVLVQASSLQQDGKVRPSVRNTNRHVVHELRQSVEPFLEGIGTTQTLLSYTDEEVAHQRHVRILHLDASHDQGFHQPVTIFHWKTIKVRLGLIEHADVEEFPCVLSNSRFGHCFPIVRGGRASSRRRHFFNPL